MITKQKYVEYLISTPINYTCANLAEHLGGMSHDVVSDYLKRERLTARHLWELVAEQIDDSPDYLTVMTREEHGFDPFLLMGFIVGSASTAEFVDLVDSLGCDGALLVAAESYTE